MNTGKPNELQALIDRARPGATIKLDPPRKEFQGPVVLRQPLTIQGQGGTIWASKGPVVIIETSGVILQDVHVEVTGNEANLSDAEATALVVQPGLGVQFTNVCVRGNFAGLDELGGVWRYPRSLRLGTLQPGICHTFILRMIACVPFTIESEIASLEIQPRSLPAGPVEVKLITDSLSAGTRLRGCLKLTTPFVCRKIEVSAHIAAENNAQTCKNQIIYTPPEWDARQSGAGGAAVGSAPATPIPGLPTMPSPAPTSAPGGGDVIAIHLDFGDDSIEDSAGVPPSFDLELTATEASPKAASPRGETAPPKPPLTPAPAPSSIPPASANPVTTPPVSKAPSRHRRINTENGPPDLFAQPNSSTPDTPVSPPANKSVPLHNPLWLGTSETTAATPATTPIDENDRSSTPGSGISADGDSNLDTDATPESVPSAAPVSPSVALSAPARKRRFTPEGGSVFGATSATTSQTPENFTAPPTDAAPSAPPPLSEPDIEQDRAPSKPTKRRNPGELSDLFGGTK